MEVLGVLEPVSQHQLGLNSQLGKSDHLENFLFLFTVRVIFFRANQLQLGDLQNILSSMNIPSGSSQGNLPCAEVCM